MRYIYAICICLISCKTIFASIRLSEAPLACCYSNKMEQSFKDNSQFVVNRVRFSTCTGVGWFPSGFKLLSANLLASSFQRYAFDSKSLACVLERFPNDQQKTKLAWPENLTFSKDGNFLAVSNSSNGKVNIYKVNKKTSKIDAIPIAFVGAFGDVGIHGVRFSPDGNYLGYVTYDPLGKIRFF
ncbi:MAG: beta-propeller fold lactonase family protein, partial [Verrucomicrobia bacterium]|nr:beta-propeller fold lactonase family protein [Verrucomicrobiota bacterium]